MNLKSRNLAYAALAVVTTLLLSGTPARAAEAPTSSHASLSSAASSSLASPAAGLAAPTATSSPFGAAQVAPSPAITGEIITATGNLPTTSSRPVWLQRKSGTTWTTIAKSTSTGQTYRLISHAPLTAATYSVRVLAPKAVVGGVQRAAITSGLTPLAVIGQTASLSMPSSTVSGADGTAALAFSPARLGRQVALEINSAGSWQTTATGSESADGSASLPLTSGQAGSYSYRATAAATAGAPATSSAPTTLTVTSPPTDTLGTGVTLSPGQSLLSADGAYRAVMQGDGNVVVYQGSTALWNTGSDPGSSLVMQSDGNLVLYRPGNQAAWSSGTQGSGNELVLQSDGNLVVYSEGHLALWSWRDGKLNNEQDTLGTARTLTAGQSLISAGDGAYRAVMQGDGNFVVYQGSTALWNTGSDPGSSLVMQSDGNLVLYRPGNQAAWSSGTQASQAVLLMQSDGNLVIYSGGTALWSWRDGRLGGSSPTAQAAAQWASAQTGSTSWQYRCLAFVYQAYLSAGLSRSNLDQLAGYTAGSNTYPIDEWNYWAGGHPPAGQWHQGHDAAPPTGAIIYFSNQLGHDSSHATISLGGGQQISPDTTTVSGPQSVDTNNYRTMLGWWLPVG